MPSFQEQGRQGKYIQQKVLICPTGISGISSLCSGACGAKLFHEGIIKAHPASNIRDAWHEYFRRSIFEGSRAKKMDYGSYKATGNALQ